MAGVCRYASLAKFRAGRSACGAGPLTRRGWPPLPAACEGWRSEEHTSELQSLRHLVCRLLLEKKKKNNQHGAVSLAVANDRPPQMSGASVVSGECAPARITSSRRNV